MTAHKTSARKTSAHKTSVRKTSARKTSAGKTSAGKKSARKVPKKAATGRDAPKRARTAARKTAQKAAPRKWSAAVTEHSDAMDLQEGVFKARSPHKIALSLKHSAEASDRRKAGAFRSAMSMLTFYINRAGHNLTPARRRILDAAKDELRAVFGKED